MFIEMAIRFNSPLRQIKNYSSMDPAGAINSDRRQAVRPGTESTAAARLETPPFSPPGHSALCQIKNDVV